MNPLDVKNECPCHYCTERNVTAMYNCHSDCERYIAWWICEMAKKCAKERERQIKTYQHENYLKNVGQKSKP